MCFLIKCIIEEEDDLEVDLVVEMAEVEVEEINNGLCALFVECLVIWWINAIKSMDNPLDTKLLLIHRVNLLIL